MAAATDSETNGTTSTESKPAFLRRVRIRGYKSIAFCDVTLEPLTILVGRNASGKSNFLDALGFLNSLSNSSVAEAVKRHGGVSAIVCKHLNSLRLDFQIEAEVPHQAARLRTTRIVSYNLVLDCVDPEDVQIVREELTTAGSQEPQLLAPTREELYRVLLNAFKGDEQHTRQYVDGMYPADRALAGSTRAGWGNTEFQKHLRSLGVYNFHPASMRAPQAHNPSGLLERTGRNVADTLSRLDRTAPAIGKRVRAYLNAIAESVIGVQPQSVGGYDTLHFQILRLPEQTKIGFDAASMSDGTLRALAALVAAFQIGPGGNAPSLVAIEEPETSLHPAAMRALVDALDEATLHTQILLTTHSAEMLDNPTIKPENIRVVQMIDGQTVIAPVDEASVEIVKRKLNSLGGLERDNQLEPDFDDIERQKQLEQGAQESPK